MERRGSRVCQLHESELRLPLPCSSGAVKWKCLAPLRPLRELSCGVGVDPKMSLEPVQKLSAPSNLQSSLSSILSALSKKTTAPSTLREFSLGLERIGRTHPYTEERNNLHMTHCYSSELVYIALSIMHTVSNTDTSSELYSEQFRRIRCLANMHAKERPRASTMHAGAVSSL
jgi:hypothetical protein